MEIVDNSLILQMSNIHAGLRLNAADYRTCRNAPCRDYKSKGRVFEPRYSPAPPTIELPFSRAARPLTNFVRAYLGERRTAHIEGLAADLAYMPVSAESPPIPHVLPLPSFPAILAAETFLSCL